MPSSGSRRTAPRSRLLRGAAAAILCLLLAATLLSGCYNPFRPPEVGAGISSPPPPANSPSNVLRLLEWAYNRRAIAEYGELFTRDYRFGFSALDPFGEAYRGDTWTREDEMISTRNLFQGGHATEPAAVGITLFLDRSFNVRNDPRPGKNPRWHKSIRTSVSLTIVDPTKKTVVSGFANFFVVRGDSAVLPQELVDRGFGPDSTRWYIERWEDDTAQRSGPSASPAPPRTASAQPAPASHRVSWGALKAIYRGPF